MLNLFFSAIQSDLQSFNFKWIFPLLECIQYIIQYIYYIIFTSGIWPLDLWNCPGIYLPYKTFGSWMWLLPSDNLFIPKHQNNLVSREENYVIKNETKFRLIWKLSNACELYVSYIYVFMFTYKTLFKVGLKSWFPSQS